MWISLIFLMFLRSSLLAHKKNSNKTWEKKPLQCNGSSEWESEKKSCHSFYSHKKSGGEANEWVSERERETLIRLKMSKFEMCHFFLQSAALLLLRVENRINYCKQLFLSHSLTFRLPIVSTNGNKSILTYAIIHLPLAIVLSRTFKAYLKSLRGL